MATKDSTPAILAYMIIGGFFGIAFAQLVALMGWPEVAAPGLARSLLASARAACASAPGFRLIGCAGAGGQPRRRVQDGVKACGKHAARGCQPQ
jgi:hypothetical protein